MPTFAPFDRVSLLLDVDRDYSTYYHLQIDQRGCTCEDCWGDLSWNPKWFVAVHSEPGVWQIEAAIPLAELTGDPVSLGKTWACNVTRVVPGQGVQAFSLPADVQPRPEGMGLLTFVPDHRQAAAPTRRRCDASEIRNHHETHEIHERKTGRKGGGRHARPVALPPLLPFFVCFVCFGVPFLLAFSSEWSYRIRWAGRVVRRALLSDNHKGEVASESS